jgi:hypothetical protein
LAVGRWLSGIAPLAMAVTPPPITLAPTQTFLLLSPTRRPTTDFLAVITSPAARPRIFLLLSASQADANDMDASLLSFQRQ